MSDQKHIHLTGICGTAMAALAGLLKQRGFKVTGSDNAVYPPMSTFLANLGIPVMQPYSDANLRPRPDLVVVGNAISRGNPEIEHVLNERIAFQSMAQVLHEYFITGRESLVVAGTHGKTTTTSMLAWIFQSAGLNPSFLVGGIAENFGSSFALKQTKHIILEGDEYDTAFFDKGPKFLHYFPDAVILTSVEFDHADIYKDLDAVKIAFKRLINLVPQRGVIIAYDGSPNIEECTAKAFCRVERYGISAAADWRVHDIEYLPAKTRWKLFRKDELFADCEFDLAGEYNVMNATAAIALASNYGISAEAIREGIGTFRSVKRRLEVRAEVGGITIIDDFAHHPTAIAGALKALRTRYPQSKLWAVCEPRSNTLRRKVFQQELRESLAVADNIVLAKIFKPEAIAEAERLSTEKVVLELNAMGKSALEANDADEIIAHITPRLRSGDIVAILSNGGFGGIYEKLPERLRQLVEAGAKH
ncbi:MAG TPA: UDP-N-acetylmuramate:L-alanyl-gamma-D-glutamyl-meso-diaminopimelate ligase [Terriglobales bacterium]|nr:UDP-N-acetylmuramate:L-alanyl-gamma-D-glutamyl-meso-diaminopimelate ligase [Terriglobales bacterium]